MESEEAGEEAVRTKARRTEIVPSMREVEEHNLDHAVFRSWCPRCVKGRAEAYGHRADKDKGRGVPVMGLTACTCAASKKRMRRRVCR